MEEEQQQQTHKLRKSMMGLLARREHSRQELFNKMHIKGFDVSLINSNIDDFINRDWQSDERYAEMLIRSRIIKCHGPVKIENELKIKGVSTEIIQHNILSKNDWVKLATEALNKRFSSNPSNEKERNKQYRFLQQRGFTYEQIRRASNLAVQSRNKVC